MVRTMTEMLATYRLKEQDVPLQDLVVKRGERMDLNNIATRRRFARQIKVLKPQSINELKLWVGHKDSVVARPSIESTERTPVNVSSEFVKDVPEVALKTLEKNRIIKVNKNLDLKSNVGLLVNQYVFGDSRPIGQLADVLTAHILDVKIVVVTAFFQDVIVEDMLVPPPVTVGRHLIIKKSGYIQMPPNSQTVMNFVTAQGNVA